MPTFRRLDSMTKSAPLTRKISITIHEAAYEPLQRLAMQDTDANVNKTIRMIIYQELIRRQLITTAQLASLYGQAS